MREAPRRRLQMNAIAIIAGLSMGGALSVAGVYLIGISSQTDEIQESRRENIRVSCDQQNQRHDNTIRALDQVLEEAIQSEPERAKRIEASRERTILLINALVPKRNCDRLVDKLVGEEH